MRKLAFLALAACSSSPQHHGPVILEPDAAIDSPPPAQLNAVAIDVFGSTTALFAYRDGQGAWQTATPDAQGTYVIYVTNDYQVVVACSDAGTSDVETLAATFADGARQFVFCSAPVPSAAQQTVAITGHMVQAGSVTFGDMASSTTAPWDFSLNVTTGNHDLIATSASNQLVIRRDQPVTMAGSIAAIDTAQEGTPMVPVTLTVDGVGSGETVRNELDLYLTNDFASWTTASSTIETPPASLLQQNDFEFLFADASTTTQDHWADTQFTGTETSFTLLPFLDGVQFTVANSTVVATWGTVPAYDDLALAVYSAAANERVRATKGWFDATHAAQLTFDLMPPGFDASWAVDLHQAHFSVFELTASSGTTTLGTSVSDSATVALRSDRERGHRSIPVALRLAHRRMDGARHRNDPEPRR